MAETYVAAASIFVALVFLCAAGLKVESLRRAREGKGAATATALLETAVAVAILAMPNAGLPAAAALTAAFLIHAMVAPDTKPCKCFGDRVSIGRTKRARVTRNGLLLTASMAGVWLA